MVAALIAPHLTGPWVGGLLAGRRDTRTLLALVFVGYGVAVGAAAMLLGRAPSAVAVSAARLGLANGPFIAATLQSCMRHAPIAARTQVLILSSSIRVPTAAASGVLAGFAGGAGGRPILLAAAVALTSAAFAAAFLPQLRSAGSA